MMKALLAAAALTAWSSTAFATAGALQPVACPTEHALYELLNASDRHDLKEAARLIGPVCESLAGLHYTVEAAMNGISTIRVFAQDGNWASSRLAYTLDEMAVAD